MLKQRFLWASLLCQEWHLTAKKVTKEVTGIGQFSLSEYIVANRIERFFLILTQPQSVIFHSKINVLKPASFLNEGSFKNL